FLACASWPAPWSVSRRCESIHPYEVIVRSSLASSCVGRPVLLASTLSFSRGGRDRVPRTRKICAVGMSDFSTATDLARLCWPRLFRRALIFSAVRFIPNASLLIPADTLAGNSGVQFFFLSLDA